MTQLEFDINEMANKYSERHACIFSAKKKDVMRHKLAGRKPQMKSYCERECLKYSGSKLKLQLQRPHDFRLLPEISSLECEKSPDDQIMLRVLKSSSSERKLAMQCLNGNWK